MVAAIPQDNEIARQFAQDLSEEELYQQSRGRQIPRFPYPPAHPVVFVKFGGPEIQAEGDTQRLAFDWVSRQCRKDNGNIYIPEVFKIFSRGGLTFLIMQLIGASTIRTFRNQFEPQHWIDEKSRYYDLVVEGIQLLRRMPVPDDATPGPYTSSKRIIKHMLFKDQSAPIEYGSIGELQDHLNRV